MRSINQSVSAWQAEFMYVLPAVETHAKIQFRHLPAERRADAIQEAIASACVSYQLLAARGRLDVVRPGPLATFAVKFVRNGRHVGGKQDAAKDALSPAAQRRYRFTSNSINHFDKHAGEWRQLAVADRNRSIPDTVAFRVDFDEWLNRLSFRDREIIAAFTAGDSTGTVAAKFGITAGRVSQLRRRYESSWTTFCGSELI